MMQDTARNRWMLGGLAGFTLALAVAVSAGAVPHPGENANARTVAASAGIAEMASSAARQSGDAPGPAHVTATPAPPTTAPPTTVTKATTPTTKAPVATTRTTQAPAPVADAVAAPVAAAAPVASPAGPVKVPRRVPSAAEVQQAIATLPQYVSTILTPSPAQVAQLGDQVCTAFDQGQTLAQVEATGLQLVTQVPLTTVKPGGADWVVRTAVTLYCPGHLTDLH